MATRRLKVKAHTIVEEVKGTDLLNKTVDIGSRVARPVIYSNPALRAVRNTADYADIALHIQNAYKATAATKHEAFDLFRNNFARCSEATITSGMALTTQTEAILRNQENLMNHGGAAFRADRRLERRFAMTNWNDPKSMEKLRSECEREFKKQHLDADVTGDNKLTNRKEAELAVLLHLKDSASFAKYIKASEEQIQTAFASYYKGIEADVGDIADALKSAGNKVNIKTLGGVDDILKKAANGQIRLTPDQLAKLQEWRGLLDVKNKKLDQYIIGRIATGEINVERVIAQGTFCGAPVDSKMADTLRALAAFANGSTLNVDIENTMLNNLGCWSIVKRMNYNSVRDVENRIKEFSTALERSGVSGLDGQSLSDMRVKDLLKIDTSGFTDAQKQAFNELMKLRQHGVNMVIRQRSQNSIRNIGTRQAARFLFGDDDELLTGYYYMKTAKDLATKALSVGYTCGVKFAGSQAFQILTTPFANALSAAQQYASTVMQPVTRFIQNTVAPAVRSAATAVRTSATNVLNTTRTAVCNAAGRSKIGRSLQSASRKRCATRATKASTKAAKAASKNIAASAGSASGVSALAGKLVVLVVVVVLCFLGIVGGLTILGHTVRAVTEGVVVLDDMLFGWIDGIEWPWEKRFNERKENLLEATIYGLEEEQANAKSATYWLNQLKLDGRSYYGYIDPNNKFRAIRFADEGDPLINQDQTTYFFLDEKAEPLTPYNTMKLVFSMTNAIVSPLNNNKDIDNFLAYSVGLWHHLNRFELTGALSICSGDGTYSYVCCKDEKGKYDQIYDFAVIKAKAGQTMSVSPIASTDDTTQQAFLCVVSKDGTEGRQVKTEKGCRATYYAGTGRSHTQYISDGSTIYSSVGQETKRLYNLATEDSWINQVMMDYDHEENYLFPKGTYVSNDGKVHTYDLNPLIPVECANNEWKSALSSKSKDDENMLTLLRGIKTCANVSTCNDPITKYCSGCVEDHKSHGTGLTAPCSCITGKTAIALPTLENAPEELKPYIHEYWTCLGHAKHFYHGSSISGYSHLMSTPCDNCQMITYTLGKKTLTAYQCLGHDGVVYCDKESDGYMHTKCEHCELTKRTYDCPGYVEYKCPGHKVCPGHYDYDDCQGHFFCPGHTLTYCTGHIEYQVVQTILSTNNESLWFEDWTYTELGKTLWWTSEKTVSSKTIRDKYQMEWNEDTKKVATGTYEQDWYTVYDLSANKFEGSPYSDSEIAAIFKQYNVTPENTESWRIDFATAALKAIGEVPYYPDGIATAWDYEGNQFGVPVNEIVENQIAYNVRGIGSAQFADLIWWNFNETQPGVHLRNTVLKTYANTKKQSSTSLQVCSETEVRTGDVVIDYNLRGEIYHTYIVIGVQGDNALLVGMGEHWAQCISVPLSHIRLIPTNWLTEGQPRGWPANRPQQTEE